ncbi:FRIGIDA-like protein 3 [Cornus florida]|uniref:FRIGIDA-like protein 3 n=1 Tax=Cornus florida TaxID=4283 RepID=UPI0028A064BF|nr:FRIGIDA-like protein 3 [Cornus florida]XP_059643994.1 FRIGIDA-like protein 3 [Cornus florida]
MSEMDQVVGIDAPTSLMEQLGKAFLELEAHKGAANDSVQWMEIEEHLSHVETVMKKKVEELEVREKEFKDKESETHALLSEREAAVAAKEQDFLDRIQELKDATVAVIAEAWANHKPASLEPIESGGGTESKVSSSLGRTNALLTASEENSPHKTGEKAVGVEEVRPRPELTQFCEQMDAKGLLNFIMENQKIIPAICDELSVALESAAEPSRLVLASLEGFYPPDDSTQEGDKMDATLQGMRRFCLMFMEAMATLLAKADPGADHLLNPETKQQARLIADEWKAKLVSADVDAAANGNSLEAEAFLQLLATFRIASEFDEEELCKLVLAVSHQRRMPELCRSLGLTHKMPDVVETLINIRKQIDAVHFVHAFQLTESFPIVPLLKTYLTEQKKNSQEKSSNLGGAGAAGEQNNENAQELAALKAVIECVREYGLKVDYPLDPLQRRVGQLEKSKPDKRKFGEFGKKQKFNKSRANGGRYGFHAPGAAPPAAVRQAAPVFNERATFAGMSESILHAGPYAYNYQAPSQPTYAQPAYDQRSYYPQDGRVTATTTYNSAAPNYGSYTGSGMQSSHQPYM